MEAQTYKEMKKLVGGRTIKALVIEGCEYWEAKDPGKWISSDVSRYIENKYGIHVRNNYINTIRASIGLSMNQQINRSVANAFTQALASFKAKEDYYER